MNEEYTLSLALVDYIPVILSSIGFFLLARMIAARDTESGRLAYAGWLMISLGGLSKASWKLLMALSSGQNNVAMLDHGLVVLMAPGFIFFTFGFWYGLRVMAGTGRPQNVWMMPAALSVIVLGAAVFTGAALYDPERTGRQIWFFILLGTMTIMNIIAGGLAIRQARRQGLMLAAALFALNLVLIILLQGMARASEQTVSLQWIEQITNIVAQGVFAYAAWKLSESVIGQVAVSSSRPA